MQRRERKKSLQSKNTSSSKYPELSSTSRTPPHEVAEGGLVVLDAGCACMAHAVTESVTAQRYDGTKRLGGCGV